MESVGKIFLILGFVFMVLGIFFVLDKNSWIGKLPGDLLVKRGGFTFYFPVSSSLLLSFLLSLIFIFLSSLRGK